MAGIICMALKSSCNNVVFPNCRRAASTAASDVMPCRRYRSASNLTCSSSSDWNSKSGWLRAVSRIRAHSLASRRTIIIASLQPQQSVDHSGNPLPVFGLSRQLLQAPLSNRIEFRLAVVLRSAPLRRDPSLLLQPEKGGVNSSFVQAEHVFAQLLKAARDPESVKRPHRLKRFQN